ncbi:hypothetical protein [Allorhodopirellula heiligendammensis]|uniref:Uncharacterized protein n=1 Tax=Allorhodopirellula heiligendammensis TaxID=2714739 RepID=A0A5C6C1K5_9BACT|nr:hypothetical protein [Allorhodopirellula heiligendammensis]TWU18022.1 hypothetical protein Poly21_01750 [Allorhodopirellula heiligendammensis]
MSVPFGAIPVPVRRVICVYYLRNGHHYAWAFTPETRQAAQRDVARWGAMELELTWADAAKILTRVRTARLGHDDMHPGCDGVAWAKTMSVASGAKSGGAA